MDKNSKPDVRPEWSLLEKILQPLGLVLLIATFVLLAVNWGKLPARVPTHFNTAGVADAWGGKNSLLLLPCTGLALYILFSVIERFPQAFNYPTEVTEDNARYLYQVAREMLVAMKVLFLLLFGYLQWKTVEAAENANFGLGKWYLPVLLIVAFGIIAIYIARMFRHKGK